ncbi:60S ribosomal protein eL14 [Calcarisporiella thermophila]|uniref:60S ribosomal protein eL14 n=1 Tax=Calcarisporiella thermophila TaxID=911321 RepID=UPI003742B9E7
MVKGSFNRLVEVGRVVMLNSGSDAGKLAVIVEIVDHRRAIVDGPSTGVKRHEHSFRRLTLLPYVVTIPRGTGSSVVKKAFEESGVIAKWQASSWAKKLEQREKRSQTSDFDRFKLMKLKKQRRAIVGPQFAALKKQAA